MSRACRRGAAVRQQGVQSVRCRPFPGPATCDLRGSGRRARTPLPERNATPVPPAVACALLDLLGCCPLSGPHIICSPSEQGGSPSRPALPCC